MDVDTKELAADEYLVRSGGEFGSRRGSIATSEDDEFGSKRSGATEAALEDHRNDYIGDELQGDRPYFARGLTLFSERRNTKYRYYHALTITKALLGLLEKANRDIQVLYVFLERDHLHVVHDCAYSNSLCRCFRVKVTRRRSKRRQLREISEQEIDAIVKYYFAVGKVRIYGKARLNNVANHHDRVLQHGLVKGPARSFVELEQHVAPPEPYSEATLGYELDGAESTFEAMGGSSSSVFGDGEAGEGSSRHKRSWDQKVPGGLPANRYVDTSKKIETKLKYICSAPISETINTELWQEDEEFKYMQSKQGAIDSAIHACELWCRTRKLKELIWFIESGNFAIGHPLRAANSERSFERMYMEIEESRGLSL